jgi:hypothetical protein
MMRMNKLILLGLILFSYFHISLAHVEYVISQSEKERFGGVDLGFLLRALKNPINILLISLDYSLRSFNLFSFKTKQIVYELCCPY